MWLLMKLRLLPRFPRRAARSLSGDWDGDLDDLGIIDPGPAFRIVEVPDPDEGVQRIPLTACARATEHTERSGRVPPPPLEAGYRWGMAAARVPCERAQVARHDEPESQTHRHALEPAVEVMPAYGASDALPAVRFERAVLAVAARTEVLASVVARLHERLEDIDERFVDLVTHEDLVEMESKRARLAAEMARLSVELKAEMDRRVSEVGRAVVDPRRRLTVDHRGPMDLADAQRVQMQADRVAEAEHLTHFETGFEARRTA